MSAEQVVAIINILGTVTFLVMVVGLLKPSLVIFRPSLQTRKGVLFVWGVVWLCLGVLSIIITQNTAPANAPLPESATTPHKLYVKVERANVRQCPLPTCNIVNTFSQNSWVTTSANSLAEAPEWIEVTYDADPAPGEQLATGYINKVTLAEEPVSTSGSVADQPPSGGGSTSSGGITIGHWADIQLTLGESFKFYFCEPVSAISGATCGGLAGATTDPRGGGPPYSFVKSSGFLPPGMALELNGTLKGTPTQEGTYNFKLCAKDLYGGEGCQDLAVVVSKDGKTPNISQPPKSGKESMTYQIDFDSYFTHNDDYSRYTEHIVVSAQKTIIRESSRDSFDGAYEDQTPIQVSVEGYRDVRCMRDGVVVSTARGTFSAGPYDGLVDIDLRYKGEEVSGVAERGLWVSFSDIEGLPKMPPRQLSGICPTAESVEEQALSARVNDLFEATYSVRNKLDEKAHPGELWGPIFKSIDGGFIDFSGAEDGGYNKYKWTSTLTVKRIN